MGLNLFNRCKSSPYAVPDSNPDPANFTIHSELKLGEYLVMLVQYPNCTNYEGQKLLVYSGFKSSKELLKKTNGKLDPHFSEEGVSPIARFKPCALSYELIRQMVQA